MVDTYGRWTEEKDYSTYPKEKWCDYDYMAAWIRKQGYEPKTDMENLITMIFSYYEKYVNCYYCGKEFVKIKLLYNQYIIL